MMDPKGEQNGHIPRNVRLSLAAIDMAQPYVCLSQISLAYPPTSSPPRRLGDASALQERKKLHTGLRARKMQAPQKSLDSVAPLISTSPAKEDSAPLSLPPLRRVASGIEVEWYVGGASKVDCTFLAWHAAPSVSKDPSGSNWSKYLASLDSPSLRDSFASVCRSGSSRPRRRTQSSLRESVDTTEDISLGSPDLFPVVASPVDSGLSRWAESTKGRASKSPSNVSNVNAPLSDSVKYSDTDPLRPLSSYRAVAQPYHTAAQRDFSPGRYWLVAWSMVDQHYGATGQGYPADMPPQSHLANVRTNPEWHKTAGHRSVHGRLFWPSDPVEVVVHSNGSYHVASTVTHCAWWDRAQIVEHDVQDTPRAASVAGWLSGMNVSIAEGLTSDLIKNMFDPAAYRPSPGERSTSAYKLYGVTLGLLLIMVVCCVVLYKMWRRSSIYSQVSSNKFANFSTLKTFRGRVTMNTLWSPTKQ